MVRKDANLTVRERDETDILHLLRARSKVVQVVHLTAIEVAKVVTDLAVVLRDTDATEENFALDLHDERIFQLPLHRVLDECVLVLTSFTKQANKGVNPFVATLAATEDMADAVDGEWTAAVVDVVGLQAFEREVCAFLDNLSLLELLTQRNQVAFLFGGCHLRFREAHAFLLIYEITIKTLV